MTVSPILEMLRTRVRFPAGPLGWLEAAARRKLLTVQSWCKRVHTPEVAHQTATPIPIFPQSNVVWNKSGDQRGRRSSLTTRCYRFSLGSGNNGRANWVWLEHPLALVDLYSCPRNSGRAFQRGIGWGTRLPRCNLYLSFERLRVRLPPWAAIANNKPQQGEK